MKNNAFYFLVALMSLLCISCGSSERTSAGGVDKTEVTNYENLKEQVRLLIGQTQNLNEIIQSDYATCPAAGATSDSLIRKICNVAQAATAEARVELKGQLSVYTQMLQTQIDAVNNSLQNTQTSLAAAQLSINSISASIASLDSRITSAEAAISALQALTASITGNLAGNMITLEIGSENAAAGPLYESVLRRNDRKRFNAYVEAFGTNISLPNNPMVPANGSSTVAISVPNATATITIANPAVITWNAHGLAAGKPVRFSTTGALPTGIIAGQIYFVAASPAPAANTFSIALTAGGAAIATSGSQSGTHRVASMDINVGDRVQLRDLSEGGGFTSGDLAKELIVSAVAANYSSFSVSLGRNANSNTAFGGTVGVAQKILGRGMGTIWKSQDPSDTAVRISTLGSRRYNFIIRVRASDVTGDTAELCYDKTDHNASFATINAAAEGGSGNINCL